MSNLAPLKVLIVEDEALLAMELESLIAEAGHEVVGWATSSAQARKFVDQTDADLAFVDIHLSDGPTGLDVAAYIKAEKPTIVVFLTANSKRVPDDFAGACGVMSKPYTVNGLVGCLRFVQEGIRKPPPIASRPVGFALAPSYASQWGLG
ncbi:MAG TPA: response regulator [Rhizobiaceae bacterium]|nr:response regulator [Rhizobiaceae bacterium]